MLSILVASSKGGCGKTTIATQLAAYFALAGKACVLLDADPQGSSQRWCEKRVGQAFPVRAVDGNRRGWERLLPADCERLIIDAPAGATAKSLQPWIERADAVLVPVLPSSFDMEATLPFLAGLVSLDAPRHARRPIGLIGNRLKPWTAASQHAVAQIQTWPHPLVAQLRDSQAYVLLAGLGKSLFDYRAENIREHQQDWDGLFTWLRAINRGK